MNFLIKHFFSDNASKGNETVNVSLADIQASDDKNLECDKEDEPLIANDSELSNTSTPFYSPQVSVEDDEGVLKHGFSDSIQVPRNHKSMLSC